MRGEIKSKSTVIAKRRRTHSEGKSDEPHDFKKLHHLLVLLFLLLLATHRER